MTYARVSITLPEDLLTAADQTAIELDRSRSWVVAEALRAYLKSREAMRTAPLVREAPVRYGVTLRPGLGPSRLAQLEADIALTPEERVRDAERTARAVPAHPQAPASRLVVFDRYEDYLDWKRREDIST
ncbi:MAG TPA: ribbon-helix-helix protein, CopG family [Gemmatimonadales bacterium]|jgi:hypothetical protein